MGKDVDAQCLAFVISLHIKDFQQGFIRSCGMFAQQHSLFGVIGYHYNVLASKIEDLMLSVCHPLLLFKPYWFKKKKKSLLQCHRKVHATVN